jgi:hypothetical protein
MLEPLKRVKMALDAPSTQANVDVLCDVESI